ncbi:MAG: C4-type zinc ribbon domain-containing protein [Candidatus Promineifilaceae bacterium]|nr:C4-type zinc ribbon domain-containing protein [Candidatus Promineifilaceae bacterium]
MSQVDLLYRLQQIDNEIEAGKRRLRQVIRLQEGNAELAAARQNLATFSERHQSRRVQQQDLSLELETLNQKARRSERRLYSGQVTNPKELSDLQQELESLSRRRAVLEDELLEAMIELEEAEADLAEAQERLKRLETEWAETRTELEQEQQQLISRINDAQRRRQELLDLISPQSLTAYDRVQQRVSSDGVVRLKQGRCQGCQVQVPAHRIKGVDEGRLVFCDSCGRILSAG